MTRIVLAALCVLSATLPARAEERPLPAIPRAGLVLPGVSRGGRAPVVADALEYQRLDGQPLKVKEGDEVKAPDGTPRKWVKVEAAADGTFRHPGLRGGYLRLEVEAAEERVMILHGGGYLFASVNGGPRTGDPYGTGWLLTPVLLKKGSNEILVQNRGDSVKLELKVPPAEVFLTDVDMTLPDFIRQEPRSYEQGLSFVYGLRVINASTSSRRGLKIATRTGPDSRLIVDLPILPPLSQTKCRCAVPVALSRINSSQAVGATAELEGPDGKPVGAKPLVIQFQVREPLQTHRRTFDSWIDYSVQYYSVVPAPPIAGVKPGLTLTLHGAAVEAQGQAACFTPKPWTHVVAPTNRRPFGFDWEDWGRLDALEVLYHAEEHFKPDPRRRWLTGHSMGGHGTWHLGVTFPDRFAAIGPSAGWVSMFSYAGLRRSDDSDPVSAMLRRATAPSDTLGLVNNLKSTGVYILHGDRDDNVPVGQARTMREALAKFHPDWAYYERPGAGHWWGNDCVDWKPMFQFFEQRTLPERKDVRRVEFTTASPGVSAECFWARVEAQVKALELSTIKIDHDPAKRSFSGQTTNVARLALDLSHLPADKPVGVELDGQKLVAPYPEAGSLWLEFDQGKWRAGAKPLPILKGPHRDGGFKDAFRNRVQFVYGTKGTAEENAWALAKARYDAETFWYRGNGSIPVIPDTAFNPAEERDRNVVLYGHAESNAAWKPLLGDSPVQVKRGALKAGERELKGDDLAALFVRPRPGSGVASVGAVSGTGIKGLRVTTRLPYFVSGTGYPDLLILDSSALLKGPAGIRAAGYFGNDWGLEKGEVAWR